MNVIALKIVLAFVFEIWWIVNDDMRVYNFLTISNTSLQSKERYIEKTLRAHGMNTECLHNVFTAVILAKLTYGASAWILSLIHI